MARQPPGAPGQAQGRISLDSEVAEFSTDDHIALGNLEIRKDFARKITQLFVTANIFVLLALTGIFIMDCVQVARGLIKPPERIVSSQVVMALLGATTIQLGTVIITITRAIFPGAKADSGAPRVRNARTSLGNPSTPGAAADDEHS